MIVNLVDQKGAEGRLESRLRTVAREVDNRNVTYEPFDFHAECSKMRSVYCLLLLPAHNLGQY